MTALHKKEAMMLSSMQGMDLKMQMMANSVAALVTKIKDMFKSKKFFMNTLKRQSQYGKGPIMARAVSMPFVMTKYEANCTMTNVLSWLIKVL